MVPVIRRWALRAAAAGIVLAAACTGGPPPDDDTGRGALHPAPPASRAVITAEPADGAQDVPAGADVAVTVAAGRLLSVRLADDRGVAVPGLTADDGTRWAPLEPLSPATPYTLDAVAEDASGLHAAHHAAFATEGPAHTVAAFLVPEDGATVGVGMPVSLRFTRPVADRAAAQRAVSVTTDPPVPVAAHWFGDRRLDIRPEHYWQPGTEVTVGVRLAGVELAPGEYGTRTGDVRFTVGPSRVATVDLDAATMTVREDGVPVRTLKISAGDARHRTYRGVMVIAEKFAETRMNARTVGLGDEYDIKDVPHAMRLTDSGTFVHGNYWAEEEVFGTENTSHGCIGLADGKGGEADSPAGWLFAHALVGDVVEVRGGSGAEVQPANGLNGWNLPWEAWQAGGAPAAGRP